MITLRRLSLPARHSQLVVFAREAHAAAGEAGMSEAEAYRVELAVDEACANIVDHAYAGDPGRIDMEIGLIPAKTFVVTLTDEGRPFKVPDGAPATPPKSVEELRVGGLGLRIIHQAMSDARWEFGVGAADGRKVNRLTMTRDLAPASTA
jgi:serine/threonine-protein kinase RsbW